MAKRKAIDRHARKAIETSSGSGFFPAIIDRNV
jgi:hypothetical protein